MVGAFASKRSPPCQDRPHPAVGRKRGIAPPSTPLSAIIGSVSTALVLCFPPMTTHLRPARNGPALHSLFRQALERLPQRSDRQRRPVELVRRHSFERRDHIL